MEVVVFSSVSLRVHLDAGLMLWIREQSEVKYLVQGAKIQRVCMCSSDNHQRDLREYNRDGRQPLL